MKGGQDEKIRIGRSKPLMAIRGFFFAVIFLLYSPRVLAREISRTCDNRNLLNQFAVETQFSPLGAAFFDDVGHGWRNGVSLGLGFQHRCNLRPMLRNTIGALARTPFVGTRIAKTDEVELVVIQPITAIFSRIQSAELRPYFGWGFSLTILEDISLRRGTRGYSAFVFETGIDIAEIEFADIGSLRLSLRTLAGPPEQGTVFISLGTVLRPAPIINRLVHSST